MEKVRGDYCGQVLEKCVKSAGMYGRSVGKVRGSGSVQVREKCGKVWEKCVEIASKCERSVRKVREKVGELWEECGKV